ncbi:hypothetical protein ABMA57_09485 [Saccharospirillum sp. HFRX-1]|uniref:hypothetical protein n=1 Tax=unclassified Saccharospirillum TaxID=2633430 RepID=UPI00371DBD76
MSIERDYKVLIYKADELVATYELHTELEDGEYVDVSSLHLDGLFTEDPLEDEGVNVILDSGLDSGVGIANGYKILWTLLSESEG